MEQTCPDSRDPVDKGTTVVYLFEFQVNREHRNIKEETSMAYFPMLLLELATVEQEFVKAIDTRSIEFWNGEYKFLKMLLRSSKG